MTLLSFIDVTEYCCVTVPTSTKSFSVSCTKVVPNNMHYDGCNIATLIQILFILIRPIFYLHGHMVLQSAMLVASAYSRESF